VDSSSVACIYDFVFYFLSDGMSVEKSHTSADHPADFATADRVAPGAAALP
jgi:hypothetical protein